MKKGKEKILIEYNVCQSIKKQLKFLIFIPASDRNLGFTSKFIILIPA